MPREVFLDIALGDIATHQDECARFKLAQDWVSRWGSTYGFESSDIQQLSTTEKDTLRDILANDPSAQKEAWMIDAPKPLGGGRIVIELFDKECPKTCDNFTALCQGGRVSKSSKKPLHYKSTHMFRLVPQFMVQGGDVTRGDGSGGDSIYNGKFNDEKAGLSKPYNEPGLVVMANSGKNSNTSQFFITLADRTTNPTQFDKIHGKYVVFGRVKKGVQILTEINSVPVEKEKPLVSITIVDCGENK